MTTSSDLETMVTKLNLKSTFQGVLMKDELSRLKPLKPLKPLKSLKPLKKEYSCGIINLNSSDVTKEENKKTGHWIAYFRKNNNNYHFCSYGSPPPQSLIDYLGLPMHTHTFTIQEFGESICGELAVLFLYLMDKDLDYVDAVLTILKMRNCEE